MKAKMHNTEFRYRNKVNNHCKGAVRFKLHVEGKYFGKYCNLGTYLEIVNQQEVQDDAERGTYIELHERYYTQKHKCVKFTRKLTFIEQLQSFMAYVTEPRADITKQMIRTSKQIDRYNEKNSNGLNAKLGK